MRCRCSTLAWAGLLAACFLLSPSTGAAGQEGKNFTQDPAVAPAQVRQAAPARPEPKEPAPAETQVQASDGPAAEWIWGPEPNRNYVFRKEFDLPERMKSAWL